MIVYEDLACGERAWAFYEKLTHRFEGDFEFSHLMWSFSVLGNPQTLALAASSAVDAQLIILSITGSTALPDYVKDWVRRWAGLVKNQKSALATLIDHKTRSGTVVGTHSFLRRTLEARQVEFFPHGISSFGLGTGRSE